MSAPDLFALSAPPAEYVVSSWLAPWPRGTHRKAHDPLPFRLINAVAGRECPEHGASSSVVSIHTFAEGAQAALNAAHETHRRMLVLATNPLQTITIPTGQAVSVDYCRVVMPPVEVEYSDDPLVVRYVARYDIGLSYTAA